MVEITLKWHSKSIRRTSLVFLLRKKKTSTESIFPAEDLLFSPVVGRRALVTRHGHLCLLEDVPLAVAIAIGGLVFPVLRLIRDLGTHGVHREGVRLQPAIGRGTERLGWGRVVGAATAAAVTFSPEGGHVEQRSKGGHGPGYNADAFFQDRPQPDSASAEHEFGHVVVQSKVTESDDGRTARAEEEWVSFYGL